MSEPTKTCHTCMRKRNCMLHARASFPPDAAEKWLRKTCPHKDRKLADGSPICQITYRAGVAPMSAWIGQEGH